MPDRETQTGFFLWAPTLFRIRKFKSLLLLLQISLWLVVTTGMASGGDSSAAAVKAFGLEGIWSPDCRKPASPDNPFVYFRTDPSGQIIHGVRVTETSWALQDEIQDVQILGSNLLKFTSVRDGWPFLTATIVMDGNRIHTIRSVGVDGTIYYDDGKEVATGKPSLSSEHCDDNLGTAPTPLFDDEAGGKRGQP